MYIYIYIHLYTHMISYAFWIVACIVDRCAPFSRSSSRAPDQSGPPRGLQLQWSTHPQLLDVVWCSVVQLLF